MVWPRYVNHDTCSTTCLSDSMFTLGTIPFLLIASDFVFITFIFMPKSFPASFTPVAIDKSSGPESAVNAVSFAYLG